MFYCALLLLRETVFTVETPIYIFMVTYKYNRIEMPILCGAYLISVHAK